MPMPIIPLVPPNPYGYPPALICVHDSHERVRKQSFDLIYTIINVMSVCYYVNDCVVLVFTKNYHDDICILRAMWDMDYGIWNVECGMSPQKLCVLVIFSSSPGRQY